MADIYTSNLSITNLSIIFQLHLVIVVAPKPCNFGNLVEIEIPCYPATMLAG